MAPLATIWCRWITNGASDATGYNGKNGANVDNPNPNHCHQWHPFLLMAILAVTSSFHGAIVAIEMALMVTNGYFQWPQ